jgi:DNA-directed RNA polymerase specialized sigma24 family protein
MSNKHAKEIFRQYSGALQPWQIKLAFGRIKRFKLPPHTWDDVMQDLAIILWSFEFDPDKAGETKVETILTRMMDNHIRMLRRCYARHQTMLERLEEMLKMSQPEPPIPDDLAAYGELHEAIAGLPELQQEVCKALMHGDSIQVIAQETGRAWSTIQFHVQCIKQVLSDKGFDQGFEQSA